MVAWMIQVLGDWGLPGIFFLMVLENIFPPIPSEVIMALAGFNVAQGRMTFVGVVVAGILGTLVGNAAWYEVARAIGVERVRPWIDRYGKWFAISPEDFSQAERLLAKYGPFAICLGRLLPGVRTLISVPAGLIRIPRVAFYGWTALGTCVWLSFLTGAGMVLEDHYDKIDKWVEPLGYVVVALFVGGYVAHLVRVWLRSRKAG